MAEQLSFTKETIHGTEVDVVVLDGSRFVPAQVIATRILGWNAASLRKEMQKRSIPNTVIRDRGVLRRIASCVPLGDGPEASFRLTHLALIQVDRVQELLQALATERSRTTALVRLRDGGR